MGLTITLAIIIFVAIVIIYLIIMFNSFIRLKNNIKKSWSNIDVILKQRRDEIPNLINTVKGYMKHEKQLLLDITKARTMSIDATGAIAQANAENTLSHTLKSLFAVTENYPELKANQNFLKLQSRISELEDIIADRREFYNDSVTIYNTRLDQFPDLIIAKIFNFKPEELFKATDEEKKNINIDL